MNPTRHSTNKWSLEITCTVPLRNEIKDDERTPCFSLVRMSEYSGGLWFTIGWVHQVSIVLDENLQKSKASTVYLEKIRSKN